MGYVLALWGEFVKFTGGRAGRTVCRQRIAVRVFCLLERTLKRLDQMVRQLPYKTDRIGQKNLLSARKF